MPKDQTIDIGKQCDKAQKLDMEEEIGLNSIVSGPHYSFLITACHQEILTINVSDH